MAFVVAGAALLVLLRFCWIVLAVVLFRFIDPWPTAFMDEREAVLVDAWRDREAERREKNPKAKAREKPQLKHQVVPYDKISPHLKRAVIAAEDATFRHHVGFDFGALLGAVEKNLKAKKVVVGGSTISQQLAKNLFLSADRSLLRKLDEAAITVVLELVLSKERILDLYLNHIEWGEGVFGCEAAARHYYGVSAAGLSADQAARLAAMIPSPRRYDKNRNDPRLSTKAARIRANMDALVAP